MRRKVTLDLTLNPRQIYHSVTITNVLALLCFFFKSINTYVHDCIFIGQPCPPGLHLSVSWLVLQYMCYDILSLKLWDGCLHRNANIWNFWWLDTTVFQVFYRLEVEIMEVEIGLCSSALLNDCFFFKKTCFFIPI